MRSALAIAALLLAACDDTEDTDGARGSCASGGALAGCPDSPSTPEAACWRLVGCGSMPVDATEPNQLDWGVCVNELERLPSERVDLVTACIASSTCDELLVYVEGRPLCFLYGDR